MQTVGATNGAPRLDLPRAFGMVGSEAGLRNILATVVTSLAVDLPGIDAALKNGDVPAANRLLHAIKGYMPIIGSDALIAQVVAVEHLSKTAGVADVLPPYQQLAPELRGLLTEIQNFLA
ncbi:MAG: Hpt domain-containing protein [Rhodoferax sp.]|nr:Hpt domain-containing protein [Rhodoferax sp.]